MSGRENIHSADDPLQVDREMTYILQKLFRKRSYMQIWKKFSCKIWLNIVKKDQVIVLVPINTTNIQTEWVNAYHSIAIYIYQQESWPWWKEKVKAENKCFNFNVYHFFMKRRRASWEKTLAYFFCTNFLQWVTTTHESSYAKC